MKNYDREDIYTDVIQEFDYLTGYCLTDGEVQTIVSDITSIIQYYLLENTN